MQDSKKLSVSVVIPNYNGRKVLEKNLLQTLTVVKGCEVIVVDDGSKDDSVKFLKDNFPEVKVVTSDKNRGFSTTVNRGVKEASEGLVFLLNTDAVPETDFFNSVLPNFDDQKVFAVGLCDKSYEGEIIVLRGRGTGRIEKGFFLHQKAESKTGFSLWANGGSSVFRKELWQKLGGMDEIYNPFYWEDVDLGYRAWKAGYKIIFEEQSKVNHYHKEGAIKKEFSQNFVKIVSYRNQFIFFWKNITDRRLIFSHLFWLPVHLAWAIIRLDSAFWFGFLKTLGLLPRILKKRSRQKKQYQLSDKEVLDIFKS